MLGVKWREFESMILLAKSKNNERNKNAQRHRDSGSSMGRLQLILLFYRDVLKERSRVLKRKTNNYLRTLQRKRSWYRIELAQLYLTGEISKELYKSLKQPHSKYLKRKREERRKLIEETQEYKDKIERQKKEFQHWLNRCNIHLIIDNTRGQ